MFFDELDLSDDVLDALDAMNFSECTPIQEQAIPIALTGSDLIAIAQTGSGKTAAYLLPIIDLLADLPAPEKIVNCVVMAPTRELAQQIEQQFDALSYYLPLSCIAVYGGTDGATFAQQQRSMREGVDVVVATPGRMIALLQTGNIDLSKVRHLILDEADRMLDMGFYDDIIRIEKLMPKERQTLLFSATMPPKIRKLAQTILRNPKEIRIAASKPAETIAQSARFVESDMIKEDVLLDVLKANRGKRIIVFAGAKQRVRELTRILRRKGVKAAEIHSDLDQKERDATVHDFRNGTVEVLVATDLLARGIDIDEVALVVNFDVPREPESYVHRIGRTGRAGDSGEALTLVSPRDRRAFSAIESVLKIKIPVDERGIPARSDRPDRKPRADRKQNPDDKQTPEKPRSKRKFHRHSRSKKGNTAQHGGADSANSSKAPKSPHKSKAPKAPRPPKAPEA